MNVKLSTILFLAAMMGFGLTIVQSAPVVIANDVVVSDQSVTITSWYPNETIINDNEGATRTFNVTINQPVDVSWLINGTEVSNYSQYTNTSAVAGYWNVTAYVHNENGTDTHTWWWRVNKPPKTLIVVCGYVLKPSGEPKLNPDVTITKLNTDENLTVRTHATSNYYRMLTDSNHLRAGDTIRFNVRYGENHTEVVNHNITDEEIKNSGFRQDIPELPDLIIESCSNMVDSENNTFDITYTVKNIGGRNAGEMEMTIYIDNIPAFNDSVERLTPGESYNSTIGPLDLPRNSPWIRVCADSENAVGEFNETNNCMKTMLSCPLPDLRAYYYVNIVDPENGRYKIRYGVYNDEEVGAGSSNETVNITTLVNGSVVSTDMIRELIPALSAISGSHNHHQNISETFTCLPNATVVVSVCADADHEILESDEDDNCCTGSFVCPAYEWKPDLTITDHKETWINRTTNRTFTITYTVENIGNVNANASTTRIVNMAGPDGGNARDERFDPVPALAMGERYNGTVTFYRLCGPGLSSMIKIDADYNETVSESDENNNNVTYKFGLPRLMFHSWLRHWIDGRNKIFRVGFTVCHDYPSGAASNPTLMYADINGNRSNVTYLVPSIPFTSEGYYVDMWVGIGPLQAPPGVDVLNVTYRLCMDRGDGIEICTDYTKLGGGACVAEDGTRFDSGSGGGGCWHGMDDITKSCTFECDILLPDNRMRIGASDIIIDGNGSALVGTGGGCIGDPSALNYMPSGIVNYNRNKKHSGYDNVTIKNMEIMDFGNAITIITANDNMIENCTIHENGKESDYTYGILMRDSNHTIINNCRVYNNTGNITVENNVCGGHGISFHDDCDYCEVTNSSIFNNRLSGIYAPTSCGYLNIANNLIECNGYGGETEFAGGVNLHWKGGPDVVTNSTVEKNVILNNTGSGIYVAQSKTTIQDNIVRGSKDNETEDEVNGYGIFIYNGHYTFLYNNTACGNEGTDIVDAGLNTIGDDNTCDTTDNYDDEGTRGCIFYCNGVNGICVGTNYNFSCGMVVNESCTFNRSISCRGHGGDGLVAGADDITIDGAGYTITGNFSGTGIFSSYGNVTIRNLQAKDFSTGIEIKKTVGNTIEGCNLRKNLLTGVNLTADNSALRESRIYDNLGPGIIVDGNNNLFLNNTAARNRGYGFYLGLYAMNNTLIANAVGDNGRIDIYDTGGNGTSNTSDNNTCDTTGNYLDNSPDGRKYGCAYPWTPPDLMISNVWEAWVDRNARTYNLNYTIKNIGKPKSREVDQSTTCLYIDDHHIRKADDPVGLLSIGDIRTRAFDYTATMTKEKDRIAVCADGPDEIREFNDADNFYHKTGFGNYTVTKERGKEESNNWYNDTIDAVGYELPEGGGVCICNDGWCDYVDRAYYVCGDAVTESCTFNGSMYCPAGVHGLRISESDLTIDGKGHEIIGDVAPAKCLYASESSPCEVSGIYNSGYDNVAIKDLKVNGFCTGIVLTNVKSNLIEGCKIHDNGFDTGSMVTHGIHLFRISKTTIRDNEIYNNRGTGASCDDGGNGLFLYAGGSSYRDNVITGNHLHHNDKSGFWTKYGLHGAGITGNTIHDNGYGSGITDGTRGGIILRCEQSNENTIEGNIVYTNDCYGIYIRGDENTLNDNTVCDNTDTDIYVDTDGWGNHGSENTCDTAVNYNDAGYTGGTYSCSNPDLSVTGKSEAWIGDPDDRTYKITYTIANVGSVTAPESEVRILIDDSPNGDYTVPALNASESYTSTIDPFTFSGDEDVINVIVDPENEIKEINEHNNNLENTWYALPDLTVTMFDVPDNLTLFGDSTASAMIANIGTIDTEDEFDITLSVNDKKEGAVRVTEKLAAGGGSTNVSFDWMVFSSNKLVVVADSGGDIVERDETNNEAMLTRSASNKPPGKPPNNPSPYTNNGVPTEDLDSFIEFDPDSEGVGGDWDYDETIGNESASGRVAKERVHAQIFRSNPFVTEVSDIVVSHNWITVAGALFLLLLFYFGYRGEIRVHRRNGR